MWKHDKVAVYTGTRNLYPMMVPAVKSLLINSDVDEIWLFIEDDEFPKEYELPDIVKTRNVKDQTYFPKDGPNMKSRFSYMALMRAALPYEFPDLDRILSLDVDTFAVKDISDLWDLPLLDKYYFAACKEPDASFYYSKKNGTKYLYTNVGVCLQNLKKLRDGKCDQIIKELNTNEYKYVDQDVMNFLCQGEIYDMPSKYNGCGFTIACDNPSIAHYAGDKVWFDKPMVAHYMDIPWDQIMKYRKRVYNK